MPAILSILSARANLSVYSRGIFRIRDDILMHTISSEFKKRKKDLVPKALIPGKINKIKILGEEDNLY